MSNCGNKNVLCDFRGAGSFLRPNSQGRWQQARCNLAPKDMGYNTPRIYLVWEKVRAGLAASESLKVELEQPIHGNILGHSATVGVFVAIEFSLCDVFLKLLVTRSRTWQRKWHGRGTECTKTRRHGPNRTEQEPDRPRTDAKKVYWKPFPGASKTWVFISYSFCGFLIFWVKLRPNK